MNDSEYEKYNVKLIVGDSNEYIEMTVKIKRQVECYINK